jgi:hypothetical protein
MSAFGGRADITLWSAFDSKRTLQIIQKARHYAELDEHSKLIAADPFFNDFSVVDAVTL